MNKIVVVPDSFKGTLSSVKICSIAEELILRLLPGCEVAALPVADGGEGTVESFYRCIGGEKIRVTVQGPFGESRVAEYLRKGELAVVELASCAGLPLAEGHPDPERATTYGVGELLRHAVEHGAGRIVLGLGGSATNDGGCGAAAALGACFYNHAGKRFVPTGGTLKDIAHIDAEGCRTLLDGVAVTVMCDVDNPLCGPRGAAYVFGPQKGADPACAKRLEQGLAHLEERIRSALGLRVGDIPGAGAAGGFGAGSVAFFGGTLKPGIDVLLDTAGFESLLDGADLVLTGEGRIDGQSLSGKAVVGVARRAKALGVPVVAVVGDVLDDAYGVYGEGVTAIFSTNRRAIPFEQAKRRSEEDFRHTLEDVLRFARELLRFG